MQDEENQIRDFLLGHLTPEAADAFESRLFLEADLYGQVEEAKFALVDDFTAGTLNTGDALRFRELCRLSPALQQMVDDSQRLRLALANRPAMQRQPWFRLSLPIFVTAFAVAAFALLAFFLFRSHEQPRPKVAALPQAALPNTPAAPLPPVFFLADLATRGPKDIPVISIDPGTSRINLQIELKGDAANVFDWKLELLSHGETMPLAEQAHLQHAGPIAYVLCPVLTTTLSNGQYTIRLTPLIPGGASLTRPFVLRHAAGQRHIPPG